jgi:putative glutamine amidotransferase
MRPVIGVCGAHEPARWSFWAQPATLVAETYLASVRRVGGLPLILPPEEVEPDDVEALLARIDGLLLVGGADVDPGRYGQEPVPQTERTVPVRDGFEIALVTAAMERDMPVLGICRGLQILNVATGGTLHQHLVLAGFAEHRPRQGDLGHATRHEVTVEPDSVVARAVGGGRQEVNSHHHQGVDVVGAGGRVSARSEPDGVPEAVEWPDRRFVVGVQWHPEVDERDRLFAPLVTAAGDGAPAVRRGPYGPLSS